MERIRILGQVLTEAQVPTTVDSSLQQDPRFRFNLARTWGNAFRAVLQGYEGDYKLLPGDAILRSFDYTHPEDHFFGVPEKHRGRGVSRYIHVDRVGKLVRAVDNNSPEGLN